MPVLKLPDKPRPTSIPIIESRIPKPDELVVLGKPLLDATIVIGKSLAGCTNKWALGGDVAEVISGVNVQPDHITILTNRQGCDEIAGKLSKYLVKPPTVIERALERNAKVDFKSYPVSIKSHASGFNIDGTSLDVHGDLQIKIGDWDWGDPLEFDPDYVYVVGVKMPVVPLKMKSELYTGLGWTDRATKIHEAIMRSRHMFG